MEIISVKITSVFETGVVKAKANAVLGRFGVRGIKVCAVSYTHLVISKVEQQPDSGHTEMTLAVTATDADSGGKGYAVTTEEKAPALDSFSTCLLYTSRCV